MVYTESAYRGRRHAYHEVMIDAWQFDGQVLYLGNLCRRVNRHRLEMLHDLERLRWRALLHSRRAQSRFKKALDFLRETGVAYYRSEHDLVDRITPRKDDYHIERIYEDRTLHPLEQLASIPEITQAQFDCGEEVTKADQWVQTCLRRVRTVEAAMVCALYSDQYIRDLVEASETKRGFVTINRRHYALGIEWHRLPLHWPTPGDVTLTLDA